MKKNLLFTFFISLFFSNIILGQNKSIIDQDNSNRLPTAQELKIKEELRIDYQKKSDIQNNLPIGVNNSAQKNGGSGNHIYVTGPEQNCGGGIDVCSQSYTQASSYTGYGYQEVASGTCLSTRETNSVWYIFTVQTSGTFGFTLSTLNDYDYALYNITAGGCAGVPGSTPVRCNFSATFGNTGMSPAGTLASCTALDGPFCTELAVTAGQTYALIVDNFSANSNGYTLTFSSGGAYASITDVTRPTINPPNTVVNNCNGTFTLTFSEYVLCSTIASNGSDFTISGGGTVTAATGVGCSASSLLTNQVTISYTVPGSGTYTVGVATGSDGNTILDKCGNAMLTSQTITLNTLYSVALATSASTVCPGGSVTLTASGAPNSMANIYTLNPGGTTASSNGSGSATFTVTPSTTTTYTVTSTFAGCTKTASQTITVNQTPVVSVTPFNPTLCSGTTTLTASATPCSGCTYSWSGGYGTAAATNAAVGAGTYTCTVTNGGCVGSGSSTVSLASAPPTGGCNVYYVGTAATGSGDGSSASNVATIATLASTILPAVACSGATIKMAVGVYTVTSNLSLVIGGNITIEGGFKSDFTMKYSMDGSTTYTTIIRRTNANPAGNNIICFTVSAGSSNFRLQDLRIELPGSASVTANSSGSQISNYGIYLGSGCSSYNIVRCYIDAGVGAN